MTTLYNTDQIEQLDSLNAVAPSGNTSLTNVLINVNSELVQPLKMTAESGFLIYIAPYKLTSSTTGYNKTNYPMSGPTIPEFNGGSITFPTIAGDHILIDPSPAPGWQIMPTIGPNKFLKISVVINNLGQIVLYFGTEGTSEALATLPSLQSPVGMDVGYIVVSTNGSGVYNSITNDNVYQYDGALNKTIILPPASETVEGIVTITTQSLGGNKTLIGNTVSNVLNVTGKINNGISHLLTTMITSVPINYYNIDIGMNAYGLGTKTEVFSGGVLLPNNTIFLVPLTITTNSTIYYTNDSNDRYPMTISTAVAGPGGYAFWGGIALPNGKAFCIPYSYTGTNTIYNPISNAWEGIASGVTDSGSSWGRFKGGVLLPNGKVLCIPYNYSGTKYVFNPTTNDWDDSPVAVGTGLSAFSGGVLLPNGKVLCMPNTYSGTKIIYNYLTDNWEDGPAKPSSDACFNTGVLLPNGKVFGISSTYTGTKVIYNPMTNSWEDGPTTPIADSFISGILMPNGKVFCTHSAYTGNMNIYNPITNLWESGAPGNGGRQYIGGVLIPRTGNIILIPYTSDTYNDMSMGFYATYTVGWPYGEWMTHGCFNKF